MVNWFELEKDKYKGKFHPDVERLINSGHVNMMAAMHLIRLPVDEQHALIVEAITHDKQLMEKTLNNWFKLPADERALIARRFYLMLADNVTADEIKRRGISTEDIENVIDAITASKGPESRIRLLKSFLRGKAEDGFDVVEALATGLNRIDHERYDRLVLMAAPGQLWAAWERLNVLAKETDDRVLAKAATEASRFLNNRYSQLQGIFHNVSTDADPPIGTIKIEGEWRRPSAFQMEHEDIGRLVSGTFMCHSCAMAHDLSYPAAIAVYPINILPYSQVCEQCNELVVSGYRRSDGWGNPLSIFDKSWETERNDTEGYNR